MVAKSACNQHFNDFFLCVCVCVCIVIPGEESYCITPLSLKSAEVILMAVFEEKKVRDVKLHQQILPACRYLKVKGIRGQSKPSVTKKLAQAFIDKEYICVDDADLANLAISNISISPEKDIKQDLKEWFKLKQNQ